ncbi:uncharacterized protein LOC112085226 [Eutrema salsugineum]|uniref:uncharacterized protein LOC112085226 n=1 Tax=Eutrema salsugineum TaxID=72664 RepID=UPI000CED2125|nr:uncharacterized protein LOC112085226 [Eutrema salsugineum]
MSFFPVPGPSPSMPAIDQTTTLSVTRHILKDFLGVEECSTCVSSQGNLSNWNSVVNIISRSHQNHLKSFIIRYLFQMTIYVLWRERNDRRHGTTPALVARLIKQIDKGVRNRFSSIRIMHDERYQEGMQVWLASRPEA